MESATGDTAISRFVVLNCERSIWKLARHLAVVSSLQDVHTRVMSNSANRTTAPAEWLESLERSKAQIAAGETVPLLPILDRLRASAERLEAEQGLPPDEAKQTAGR